MYLCYNVGQAIICTSILTSRQKNSNRANYSWLQPNRLCWSWGRIDYTEFPPNCITHGNAVPYAKIPINAINFPLNPKNPVCYSPSPTTQPERQKTESADPIWRNAVSWSNSWGFATILAMTSNGIHNPNNKRLVVSSSENTRCIQPMHRYLSVHRGFDFWGLRR